MIRHPLIEAMLHSKPWCGTESAGHAIAKHLRRSSTSQATDTSAAKEAGQGKRATAAASKMFAASGRLTAISLAEPAQEQCVAVIPVFGIIGKYLSWLETECGGFDLVGFERALQQAAADPTVTNILLHVGSPGGIVTGVPEAAHLVSVVNQTKPVFTFCDSEMCSAAYWIGCAGSGVFCSPSAVLGSIGVYLAWIDDSKAMAAEGLELILIKDGDFKACTLPGQLTEDAKALLQASVLAVGTDFRGDVVRYRNACSGVSIAVETMQGQTFRGQSAVDCGLADSVYWSLDEVVLELLTNQKGTP